MKRMILIVVLVIPILSLKSQERIERKKIYTARIKLMTDDPYILRRRVLFEVKDSSIVVSYERRISMIDDPNLNEYAYNNIEAIRIGEKNRVSKGLLYGALTGIALGGIIGLSSGDDPPGWFAWTAEEKALIGGILGAFGGGLVGTGVGALATVNIPIHGNFNNFKKNKHILQERSYRK
jgi:hypothetical protein